MPKILTLKQLVKAKACKEQCDEFKRRFGASVEITPELCESVASVFSFYWATEHLLTAPARAKYERIRAHAEGTSASRRTYERIVAHARTEYERIRARTFGELYSQ
jgi:hypothetical protein